MDFPSLAYPDYWAFAVAVLIALGVAHLRLHRHGKRKWISGADWMIVLCGLAYGWLAIDYAVKWQDARIGEVIQRLVVPLNAHVKGQHASETVSENGGEVAAAEGFTGNSERARRENAVAGPGLFLVADPANAGPAVVDIDYVQRKKAVALTAMQSMATAVVASLFLAIAGIVVYIRVRDDFLKAEIESARALAESEARFHLLYTASPQAIVVTDSGGFIRDANPAACELVQRNAEKIAGAHLLELADGNQGHRTLDRIRGLAVGEIDHIEDVCFKSRERDRIHVELHARKIQNFDGPACLVHVHDLTDRISLEQEIRQTQKMEGIGQLAAGVAHDFNNLLTVIQGHSLLLLDKEECGSEASQSLEEIALAAERAAELTAHLLSFSRKQSMHLEILDLNRMLEELVRPLERILPESIELKTNPGESVPSVKADHGMIERAITNLVTNARDAMPDGGRLELSTSTVVVGFNEVAEKLDALPGKYAVISIKDTGEGIDEKTRDRIFEPFFTTKSVGQGSGLGLASAYGIVSHHGGWIDVASDSDEGTSFSIMLPAREVSSVATTAATAATAGDSVKDVDMARGDETIFVVEDETALRELVAMHLVKCGYQVIEARSGREALRMWKDVKERVDLLLTDLVMPEGVSGRELGEYIGAENGKLPILYMSGYSGSVSGIDEHFDNLILKKPYTPNALARKIRSMLDKD